MKNKKEISKKHRALKKGIETKHLNIRIAADDLEKIQNIAKSRGIDTSSYTRMLILDEIKNFRKIFMD